MEGGDCWATVHGIAKSQARLSDFHSFLKNVSDFYLFIFSHLFFLVGG